jgi:hypothetical protein
MGMTLGNRQVIERNERDGRGASNTLTVVLFLLPSVVFF